MFPFWPEPYTRPALSTPGSLSKGNGLSSGLLSVRRGRKHSIADLFGARRSTDQRNRERVTIKLALFRDLPRAETITVHSSKLRRNGLRELSLPFLHHRAIKLKSRMK